MPPTENTDRRGAPVAASASTDATAVTPPGAADVPAEPTWLEIAEAEAAAAGPELSLDGDVLSARRSLRASRNRRAALARRAQRLKLSRRSVAVALAGTVALGAGGAAAQSGGDSGSSSARVAKTGSQGSLVQAIQAKVGVAADGVYGPVTRAAVKRFQRANGLAVDGIAGPATLGAMGISGGSATSSSPSSTSSSSRASASGGSAPNATLARIAQCESGGNPSAIGGGGLHRGKYQFTRATWRDMGGSGDPAKAPESEQDARAAKLLAQRGTSPWPNCG